MWIVGLTTGAALLGALAYVYVPTDKIQSPALATAVNYGTPVVVGAVIGMIAYAAS